MRRTLALLLLLLAACPRQRAVPPAGDLALEVAVQPQGRAGQPVALRMRLANRGAAPLSVSPRWEGNVRVVSLTRDGKAVPARTGATHFEVDLGGAIAATLIALAPGAAAEFAWRSELDARLGGQALRAIRVEGAGHGTETLHALHEPGHYALSLAYKAAAAGAYPVEVSAAVEFDLAP